MDDREDWKVNIASATDLAHDDDDDDDNVSIACSTSS